MIGVAAVMVLPNIVKETIALADTYSASQLILHYYGCRTSQCVVTAAVLFAGGGKVVAQGTCGAADLYLAYVAVYCFAMALDL